MMSRVEGVPPDQVKIGTAVKARIAKLNGVGDCGGVPSSQVTSVWGAVGTF